MAGKETDIKDAVSCVDAVNAMFWCAGPAHQFDRYYKDGKLDDCNRQMRELQFCVKLKFAGPEETKKLVRELLISNKSPTIGSIWEPANQSGTKK